MYTGRRKDPYTLFYSGPIKRPNERTKHKTLKEVQFPQSTTLGMDRPVEARQYRRQDVRKDHSFSKTTSRCIFKKIVYAKVLHNPMSQCNRGSIPY